MSLVSEALRKARQEAAERGEKQRGLMFRTTVVLGGGKARGLGWIAALAIVAAALAGAAVAWLALPSRAPAPTPAAERAEAAPAAVAAHPAETPAASVRPAAQAPAPPPRAAAAAPVAETGASATAAPAHGAAIPAAPPAALTRVPSAPADKSEAPRAGERTYVLDADLGRVKFHLDFIVYRSKDPFAEINGQQVVVGSILEGYTVEEIAPDYVRLAGPVGAVTIRTH